MAQVQNTNEAQPVNTLVLDTETGTLNPTSGFEGVPLPNIVNNLVKGDKRTKTPALIPEAEDKAVRASNGENSVNGWDITITNNLNGATINSTGITEIGASVEKPSWKSVSITQAFHHLGAMAGCPQTAKFVNTLTDALALEAAGADAETIAQHYADNQINWSPSTEAKNNLVNKIRVATTSTSAAKITITRD